MQFASMCSLTKHDCNYICRCGPATQLSMCTLFGLLKAPPTSRLLLLLLLLPPRSQHVICQMSEKRLEGKMLNMSATTGFPPS